MSEARPLSDILPYAAGSRQDIAAVFTVEGAVGVVQWLSCVQLFATPWTAVCQASLSFTISWSLLKLTSIESVMQSNSVLILCPISSSVIPFSSCLQSFPASGSFLMSWFFSSGGQNIGASALASILLMSIQD